MSRRMLHCPECHEERLFERPHDRANCPDTAHSPDGGCPELACVKCGAALIIGFALRSLTRAAAGAEQPDSPGRAA